MLVTECESIEASALLAEYKELSGIQISRQKTIANLATIYPTVVFTVFGIIVGIVSNKQSELNPWQEYYSLIFLISSVISSLLIIFSVNTLYKVATIGLYMDTILGRRLSQLARKDVLIYEHRFLANVPYHRFYKWEATFEVVATGMWLFLLLITDFGGIIMFLVFGCKNTIVGNIMLSVASVFLIISLSYSILVAIAMSKMVKQATNELS